MPEEQLSDDPIVEAERAEREMYGYIEAGESFIMEAGAGAGKTYSLKKALSYTLESKRRLFLERSQKIACITFTEAATRDLAKEVDNHPLVSVSTIHSFCWSILKDFQPQLRGCLTKVDKWSKYIDDEHPISDQKVVYDVGYRTIDSEKISLHHDDVPLIMSMFLENTKFQRLFISRFPILYIDEYQDTQSDLMNSFIRMLEAGRLIQIGLFGDSWQMIYEGVCGAVVSTKLKLIKKHANFRSDKRIVDKLNLLRPELKQVSRHDEPFTSHIAVYLTENWVGERGSGPHREGSLPDDIAHDYYDKLLQVLRGEGWDFNDSNTKILMLTNTVLAREQGYSELLAQFPYPRTDQLMNAEHRYIKLFMEKIEPIAAAFEGGMFGDIFSTLGGSSRVRNHQDKVKWHKYMLELMHLRESASIGEVVDYIVANKKERIGVSDGFLRAEALLRDYVEDPSSINEDDDIIKKYLRLINLRAISYKQIIAFYHYLNEQTPFATNHKVKGLQYENVLVVISQNWNKYNFNKMLEWGYESNVPSDKTDFFIQNRNLFYVVCSRPKKRLAILFARSLSDTAKQRLDEWFGGENIKELGI